jgi:glycosyltransferase involved in cell wall biosynthesis
MDVARSLDRPLTLAGPIVDADYFARCVEPHLDDRMRYVGTVGHEAKVELMGRAACVLMPSRIDEAYGMVAIEAMACGTPVVALASGALPEIVEPHLSGFVTEDATALADLVRAAEKLDRRAIRRRASERFAIDVAADRYLRLYEEIRAHEA